MRFSRDIQRCSPVFRVRWAWHHCIGGANGGHEAADGSKSTELGQWILGKFSSWLVDDFFIGSGGIRSKIYWGLWNTPLGESHGKLVMSRHIRNVGCISHFTMKRFNSIIGLPAMDLGGTSSFIIFATYPNEMRVAALTLDLHLETIRMMGSDR